MTSRRVEPLLLVALALTIAVHGALLLSGSYRATYDAYVHIFFADHYARDWFSTWETRWYTGFTVTSYPPGGHMLVALASGVVGLQTGFALVQLGALVLLVIGVYRFSLLWVERRAAGWAAVLASLTPVLGLVVHVFGQLPTTVGLAFTLNALPFGAAWVDRGRRRDLVAALACGSAATAAHHVTTLFGAVFFVAPVVLAVLLRALRTPLPGEQLGRPARLIRADVWPLVARRLRRVSGPVLRAGVYAVLLVTSLVVVVLPYWLWSQADPIVQIPIPHSSRSNFLVDRNAGLVFWLVPWGAVLLAWPLAVLRGWRSTSWPLAASVSLLTLLGLGGTTPVPRALLGGAFDILTFDRFTVWAAIAILPLVGQVLVDVAEGRMLAWLRPAIGRNGLRVVAGGLAAAMLGSFLFAATLTRYRPFQPEPIDPGPITEFLAKDDHDRWRYLTLGFGDQMAWIAANTTATTVDGNYHSARRLPELTTRPVERLEGAKYRGVPGLGSLQQFLAIPERYNLKYVFSDDRFYDPLLDASGWQRLGTLENGIEVWERADIPPLPVQLPVRELPAWQRLAWGTLPPLALLAAGVVLVLQALRPARGGRPAAPARSLARLDARLAAATGRIAPEVTETAWQVWRDWPARVAARLPRPSGAVALRTTLALVLVVVAVPVVLTALAVQEPDEPGEVVVDYLTALDERRFAEAHALLDPATAPSLELFTLARSVDGGGLRASYASLDSVVTSVVERDGDRTVVLADADYVTSLAAYRASDRYELVADAAGAWRIVAPERDAAQPVEAFARRAGVDYQEAERRSTTTGRTAFGDVLDRPELTVRSARLLQVDGRYVVVGEVRNDSVDPADLTITAQLRGPEGEVWATYNAVQQVRHRLRPAESTPFRIEFEGVAGETAAAELAEGGFDPDEYTPPVLPPDAVVTGFDLYAKALVTSKGLERDLAVEGVTVEVVDGDVVVRGSIRNLGTSEAAVPRVLVAARDVGDGVLWVEQQHVEQAVRPQQAVPFEVVLEDLGTIEVLDDGGTQWVNARQDQEQTGTGEPWVATVSTPAGELGISIGVDAFYRGGA